MLAFAVVNAVGDVIGADGTVLAGSSAPAGSPAFPADAPFEEDRAHTTLVVVVSDAVCDKAACHLLAQSAHDGFARALHPSRTRFDGDVAIGSRRARWRRTSIGCASRPPTSWPTRYARPPGSIRRVSPRRSRPGRSVSPDPFLVSPHPAQAAGATLAEVAAVASGCELCKLAAGRTQVVWGR